jgi:hypothetical protein
MRAMRRGVGALMLVCGIACTDGKDSASEDTSDGESDVDTDMDTDPGCGPPPPSATWGPSTVTLSVAAGPGAYWFGMAQTSNGDAGTAGSDDWTGEDCVWGYETVAGDTLSYCHWAGDAGVALAYGGDLLDLQEGSTVFVDSSFDGQVTYYLESDPVYGGDGSCYFWGHDASYYGGLGCTEM